MTNHNFLLASCPFIVELSMFSGSNNDEVALAVNQELQLQTMERSADKNIATTAQPSIDTFVKKRVTDEDTGAGIFGALNHIDFNVEAKKKRMKTKNAEYKFADVDFTEVLKFEAF